MLDAIVSVVGAAIILVVMRDIVHELFHPETSGSISRVVMLGVWRIMRRVARRHRRALFDAGPLMLIAVAGVWTVLLGVGWALIYWPRLPADFHVAGGLTGPASHGFLSALYVSMSTLTTIGASDLTPRVGALRLIYTAEGLVGLVMITAWITWVLSIYPVIAERRAFTREVMTLRQAEPRPGTAVREAPVETSADVLRTLTEQVIRIGSQLQQSRVTYYFQNEDPNVALAEQLPWALSYAHAAEERGTEPAIRRHGVLLRTAIEQLLTQIGAEFLGLPDAPPGRIIMALAEDHLIAKRQGAAS